MTLGSNTLYPSASRRDAARHTRSSAQNVLPHGGICLRRFFAPSSLDDLDWHGIGPEVSALPLAIQSPRFLVQLPCA